MALTPVLTVGSPKIFTLKAGRPNPIKLQFVGDARVKWSETSATKRTVDGQTVTIRGELNGVTSKPQTAVLGYVDAKCTGASTVYLSPSHDVTVAVEVSKGPGFFMRLFGR